MPNLSNMLPLNGKLLQPSHHDGMVIDVSGPLPASDVEEAFVRSLPWEGLVELEQVFRFALPAYGDSWSHAFNEMLEFPSDATIIGELVNELKASAEGVFSKPISISFTEPSDWDERDEAEYGPRPIQPHVGNGMHRLAAALLAGASKVLVMKGSPDVNDAELVEIEAELTFPQGLDVDGECLLLDWTRSFRLTPDVWVENDGWYASGRVYEWLFYCPHALEGLLLEALASRISERGMTFKLVSSKLTSWSQKEAEWDAEDREKAAVSAS